MPIALNFLPAKFGDCIWIEYGTSGDTHRILIDGGTAGTRNILKQMIDELPEAERHFDLMVVTHIDRDHIEGILGLLEDADELNFTIGDFWFNGFKHLPEDDNEAFGAVQGERLTAAILKHELPWNITFEGNAVVIEDENNLPVINLAVNMKLTLLSPYIEHLVKLRPKWEEEVKAAGLVPGFGMEEGAPEVDDPDVEGFGANPDIEVLNNSVFKEDDAKANGSSIAFLLEHDGNT